MSNYKLLNNGDNDVKLYSTMSSVTYMNADDYKIYSLFISHDVSNSIDYSPINIVQINKYTLNYKSIIFDNNYLVNENTKINQDENSIYVNLNQLNNTNKILKYNKNTF